MFVNGFPTKTDNMIGPTLVPFIWFGGMSVVFFFYRKCCLPEYCRNAMEIVLYFQSSTVYSDAICNAGLSTEVHSVSERCFLNVFLEVVTITPST
jgi:hypothetical protein